MQTIEIKCPGCGERLSVDMKECPSCHGPVIITSFNSVYSMSALDANKYASAYRKALTEDPENTGLNTSVAMCYLKLKMYDKALAAFEKAVEDNFDNSETYFYAAVCLLQGKKAFLHQRPVIDKIIEYLNAAVMIEPRGIYYYFLAYIKYDYFARKYFITSPTYQEALQTARSRGVSEYDISRLYEVLGVERPACL